jgi:protease PrsW
MGFATLENIGYVYQHGWGTGIMRMFLSVPAHATFAVLMGYHFGLAKFDYADRGRHFLLAIILPVLFHGAYDFFLFLGNDLLHIGGALISFYIAIRLSQKAIRKQQELSKNYLNGGSSISDGDHSLL